MTNINDLFKSTISFESNNYFDITLSLVYKGSEKLKDISPTVRVSSWTKNKFYTINLENLTILEKVSKDDQTIINEALEYIKFHQQLLLAYWNGTINEYEAKQIFFDEKNEWFGITHLTPKETHLPMHIILYCPYIIERDNIIFFQNSYGKLNYKSMVMMSVDKTNPQILVDRKINIKEEDIQLLKDFVIKNYEVLTKYNNDNLSDNELFELVDEIKN